MKSVVFPYKVVVNGVVTRCYVWARTDGSTKAEVYRTIVIDADHLSPEQLDKFGAIITGFLTENGGDWISEAYDAYDCEHGTGAVD